MFGKDKVKGHNRLIKSKKGLKVTRIGDFLRKKDNNEKRNLAIGVGVTAALGLGAGLLLRKKGIKFPAKIKSTTTKNPIEVIEEVVGTPPKTKPISGKDFIQQMDDELKIIPDTTKTKVPTKELEDTVITNPWDSPIETIIEKSKRVVKNKEGQLLLSPAKKPNPRGNLLKTGGPLTSKEKVVSRLANGYATLPLPMKVTLQMEKAMKLPIKEGVGRPLDTRGLKTILDVPKNVDSDIIIKKATRKVTTRLKTQAEKKAKRKAQAAINDVKKKQLDDIVPNPSRRGLLGVEKVKATLAERDKLGNIAINAIAEQKSPMGRAIQQINKIAKDPEAEKLGIQVRAEEWEKALASVTGRRRAIKATGKGAGEAAQSLAYARVVKPKIIKTLMGELKSGNLETTNPKGYAERLRKIHDNFDELMVKEGSNYRELSRRELGRRVGQVMKPEIDDAVTKAKDFATSSRTLTDTFYENSQMMEAFKEAGITDRKAQFAVKMLMKLGGLG